MHVFFPSNKFPIAFNMTINWKFQHELAIRKIDVLSLNSFRMRSKLSSSSALYSRLSSSAVGVIKTGNFHMFIIFT